LETICAHCLERDPRARYQSAGDLAADLERWLDGRPIIARPISPPARIWRWSRRNPKLVGAATAGLVLGAAAVSLFHAEFFERRSLIRPIRLLQFCPSATLARQKIRDTNSPFDLPPRNKPGSGTYDSYLQRLFTDLTHPISSTGVSVSLQNPSSPFTVPDYTSPGEVDPSRPDTRVAAAPPGTAVTNRVRDRASEAGLRMNKSTPDVTAAPPGTAVATTVRYRASETGPRTNKITADGPASIQGFVKDAKGEPINGAGVRIESRDGKQVFGTVTTDPKGRYISQGLQPGVYRVTLLVNGAAKASIMNTQTKANQPTQLNFDLKPASQAGNIAKGGKRMVWVPARTGSHIGGNWVEVDDGAKTHSGLNVQRVTVRNW